MTQDEVSSSLPDLGELAQHGPAVHVPLATEAEAAASPAMLNLTDALKDAPRIVNLTIVTAETQCPCTFWTGLMRPGSTAPQTLLHAKDAAALFELAARDGVSESGPLMLTDSQQDPPRFFYLLPVPSNNFRDRALWVNDAVTTTKAWAPASAGFYLAPELLDAPAASELLLLALRDLILNSPTSQFYLLLGAHGITGILNAALQLKWELERDGVSVYVYH